MSAAAAASRNLNGIRKAAVLLVLLGEEAAATVYRHLSPDPAATADAGDSRAERSPARRSRPRSWRNITGSAWLRTIWRRAAKTTPARC